jgi:hypothetical protein
MGLSGFEAFTTRLIFKYDLKRRAYPKAILERMLAASPFGGGDIHEVGIGFEICLTK